MREVSRLPGSVIGISSRSLALPLVTTQRASPRALVRPTTVKNLTCQLGASRKHWPAQLLCLAQPDSKPASLFKTISITGEISSRFRLCHDRNVQLQEVTSVFSASSLSFTLAVLVIASTQSTKRALAVKTKENAKFISDTKKTSTCRFISSTLHW